MGNYLSTLFCVLIFSGLIPIASKNIKLIRTNIYKVLQFIRINLPSLNGTSVRGATYFNHLKMIKSYSFT